MLPAWPDDVPYRALAGSWSMPEPFLPSVDTEMEGGNLRKRRRPGDDVSTIEFRIAMTRDEWESLEAFLVDDLSNGTSRFRMNVWLGNGYVAKIVQFPAQFMPSVAEYGLDVSVPMRLRVYLSAIAVPIPEFIGAVGGAGMAAGIGASTWAAIGAASGAASVSGVGSSTVVGVFSAVGAASGSSTAAAAGSSTAAAAGLAVGVGQAAGTDSVWLLSGGVWWDNGIWVDGAVWED